MATITLTVEPSQAGERLDRFLAKALPEVSRSRIQRLIKQGEVWVNGRTVRPSYLTEIGDTITLTLEEEAAPQPTPEPLPLDIVYEDESILVVNKPAGMVVHQAPGHTHETLVNALLYHRPALVEAGLDPQRPGIVHRLDRDTSGLLVIAKTPEALTALQRQFRRRQVDKRYLALVYGCPAPSRAAIEAPIGRDPTNRLRMAIVPEGGRFARTEYQVVERFRDAALLEVHLLTGRTHQVRVHLASIGHPIVGDRVYGRKRETIPAPRQMLHAWRLSLQHPLKAWEMTFESELPSDFAHVLEQLRHQR